MVTPELWDNTLIILIAKSMHKASSLISKYKQLQTNNQRHTSYLVSASVLEKVLKITQLMTDACKRRTAMITSRHWQPWSAAILRTMTEHTRSSVHFDPNESQLSAGVWSDWWSPVSQLPKLKQSKTQAVATQRCKISEIHLPFFALHENTRRGSTGTPESESEWNLLKRNRKTSTGVIRKR